MARSVTRSQRRVNLARMMAQRAAEAAEREHQRAVPLEERNHDSPSPHKRPRVEHASDDEVDTTVASVLGGVVDEAVVAAATSAAEVAEAAMEEEEQTAVATPVEEVADEPEVAGTVEEGAYGSFVEALETATGAVGNRAGGSECGSFLASLQAVSSDEEQQEDSGVEEVEEELDVSPLKQLDDINIVQTPAELRADVFAILNSDGEDSETETETEYYEDPDVTITDDQWSVDSDEDVDEGVPAAELPDSEFSRASRDRPSLRTMGDDGWELGEL
jgi:hypothetical protein